MIFLILFSAMQQRRLSAIMFTDIAGYTALMGKDEDKAFEILKINREIHTTLFEKYEGSLIKEMGDGILASFPSASQAVLCAMAIQQEAQSENIKLRIGIHEGEVVFEGDDVLGDGVNVASRLEAMAEEGHINISGAVYKEIKNKPGIGVEFLAEKTLKNVEDPVRIYRILGNNEKIQKKSVTTVRKTVWLRYRKLKYLPAVIMILIIACVVAYLKIKIPPVERDKSIAVLPFINDSREEEAVYFANGVMEAILNNLAKIEDLRVPGRTSVEQFRSHTAGDIPQIARKLGVSYVLEGSVQKYENRIRINLQLLDGQTDKHLWSEQYDRDFVNILEVESELAQIVARELKATITPQEKQYIEKIPTKNLTAYNLFLQARDEHTRYWLDNYNRQALENAIILYNRSLIYDSAYAQAYTGLALAYREKNYWLTYLNENFLDSAMILANKALYYNPDLEEAYFVKGEYYNDHGAYQQAINAFNQSVSINPNYSMGYWRRGHVYLMGLYSYIESIKDLNYAVKLDHSPILPLIIAEQGNLYAIAGFVDKSKYFFSESLKLNNDTIFYMQNMAGVAFYEDNIEKALGIYRKIIARDAENIEALDNLFSYYSITGQFPEAYQALMKYLDVETEKKYFNPRIRHRIALVFWKHGDTAKAEYYFNEQIRYCRESIRLGRNYYAPYYDLAGIYAFQGNKDKALQLLDEINQRKLIPSWLVVFLKYDPFFDNLRNDPRFQKILTDSDQDALEKHEQLKSWLEKEELL